MAIQVRKAKRQAAKERKKNSPVQYKPSFAEEAQAQYQSLLVQLGAIPRDKITSDKGLVRLISRTSIAYMKFIKRRSDRKFQKYASFSNLAKRLEKELLSIPLPVSGSAGDSSAVGTPGVVQG